MQTLKQALISDKYEWGMFFTALIQQNLTTNTPILDRPSDFYFSIPTVPQIRQNMAL